MSAQGSSNQKLSRLAGDIEYCLRKINPATDVHAILTEVMKDLRAPAEPVDAHKVQCKCGWVGMTTELVRLDGKHECPACSAEFKALSAWPPLKSSEQCPGCVAAWPRPNGSPWLHLSPQGERLCEDIDAINSASLENRSES